jgi:pilus assembly protein CpaE
MSQRRPRAALISVDGSFQDLVRHTLADPEVGVDLALEFAVRFAEFDEEQVARIRENAPEIVVVDLTDDPDLGVKFIQFLSELGGSRKVIAAGPALEPGLLLAAMRAGISDYLPKPVSPESFTEALARASSQLGKGAEKDRKPGQLFTFFSSKGGAGSTSIAANTAIVLHRLTGKRTLLVDLDLELGELSLVMGVQPRFNFVDLVQNFHRMDSGLLSSYIEQHSSGVHLLSAPFHPERTETVSGEEIRRILHFLRQQYDYLVVDTPKSFAPTTFAAIDQSDAVFLIASLDIPSLRNIQRGLPMLKRALPRGEEQLRLIINRYQSESDITLDDVENTIGLKVFGTIANDYEAVIGAINTGKPVVLNGSSSYSRDVRSLVGRMTGLKGEESKKGGVVGRLMGRLRDRSGEKEK